MAFAPRKYHSNTVTTGGSSSRHVPWSFPLKKSERISKPLRVFVCYREAQILSMDVNIGLSFINSISFAHADCLSKFYTYLPHLLLV